MNTVLWIPSNDTHADFMADLILSDRSGKCMILPVKEEGAGDALKKKGIDYQVYSEKRLEVMKPSVVVFGNDWGWEERDIIYQCRNLGIPTIVIQEGPLDFLDETGHRMKCADYAFVMGKVMNKFLLRWGIRVTGNPKFNRFERKAKPEKPVVMVNYNFTYGVYEEHKESWLEDVADVCRELGVNFFISRHPRNYDDLSEYPVRESCAAVVREHIEASSILISRFSTVIHEVLMWNRSVIYYNPFNEHHRIFNEDQTGAVNKVSDKDGLRRVLKRCISEDASEKSHKEFLNIHCNIGSDDCAHAVSNIREGIEDVMKLRKLKQMLLKLQWLVNDLKVLMNSDEILRKHGEEELFHLFDVFFKSRKYRSALYIARKIVKSGSNKRDIARGELLKREATWMISGSEQSSCGSEATGSFMERYRLGSSLKKCGKREAASEIFKDIIVNCEDNNIRGAAAYHLGDIERFEGDSESAGRYFKKTLGFKPGHYKAACYLKRVESGEL